MRKARGFVTPLTRAVKTTMELELLTDLIDALGKVASTRTNLERSGLEKNTFMCVIPSTNKAALNKHQQNESSQQWQPLVEKTMLMTNFQDLVRCTTLCSPPRAHG